MAQKLMRRKHTNSKFGCLNCKKKKIRCDETLPQCQNCTKGKRDVCSYLSLDVKELNRIKLTHSLRNEQNKLLNSDYRLPTSIARVNVAYETDLEFEFELNKLPLPIPPTRYPSLQYQILTIYDFDSEFKVIEDEDSNKSDETYRPMSQYLSGGPQLESSLVYPTKFKRLKHQIRLNPKVKYNEYKFTKGTSLDYMLPYLYKRLPGVEVLEDLCIFIGQVVIFNEFKNNKAHDKTMIHQFKQKVSKMYHKCLKIITMKTKEFTNITDMTDNNTEYMTRMTPILYYSNNLFSYCLLLLDHSLENYNKINSASLGILRQFIQYNRGGHIEDEVINSLISLNQYHILSIHVPIYDPSYIFDILATFQQLKLVYYELNITNARILQLYSQLSNFIQREIIPIIESQDINSNKAVVFPLKNTFNLLKTWLKMFPSEFFVPVSMPDYVDQCIIANLACYYYCVGAMLRSTFPYHLYFFGLNFTTSENNFPCWYFQPNINSRVNDVLKRQNYYGLRIYSFLRHRHSIFIKHITWKSNNYPKHRFESRRFDKIIETPIKNFKTTLIRPEHYPSNVESCTKGHMFDRRDESYILQLYARNVETLDFFDSNCILQFDFESFRLLRDYRPNQADCFTQYEPLGVEELEFYKEDRKILMEQS